MTREVQRLDIVSNQNLEGGAQPMDLHFSPQLALVTADAIHDICGDVSKLASKLVGQSGLLLKQRRLVELPFEGPGTRNC